MPRNPWLLLALPVALAACGGGDSAQTADLAGGDTSAIAPSAPVTPAPMDSAALTDGQVAMILTAADSAEIDPSQLAQEKAQNAQVKAFAQKMIQDHGMLEDSLHALVQAQSITLAPSDLASQIHTQSATMLQQLQGLTGAAFDSAYVAAMVQSHQMALSTIDGQLIPAAQNPQLRMALQQKVRPAVAGHLQEIQQIQQGM